MKLSLKIITDFVKVEFFTVLLYLLITFVSYFIQGVYIPKLTSQLLNSEKFIKSLESIVFFWTLANVLGTINWKIYVALFPKFDAFIRTTLTKLVYERYEKDFKDLDLSIFIAKYLRSPSTLRQLLNEIFQNILPKMFLLIITLTTIYNLNKKISIIVGIIIGLSMIISTKFPACYIKSREYHQTLTNVSGVFYDNFNNLFNVYISGEKENEIKNAEVLNRLILSSQNEDYNCQSSIRDFGNVLGIVIFIFSAYSTIDLYKNNLLDKEKSAQIFLTISAFLNYYLSLMASSGYSVDVLALVHENELFLEELLQKPLIKNIQFIPKEGKIKFTDVSFGYSDRLLFSNFNFTIEPQDKVGIVGPSGSGKSTLVKIILGFYVLKGGKVEIDDQDISNVSLESLRKSITYVSQNTRLFNNTVLFNITYGTNKSENDVEELVTNLGVKNIFSDGLHKKIGVNGDQLSGGQKQIVHLLRALLSDNKIIILDEPTAAVDVSHKRLIKDIIRQIGKTKTLILITHDSELSDLVNKFIYLKI